MWTSIRKFFKDSEVIFLARLQMFVAVAIAVVATIDPNLFLDYVPAKWVPVYLIVSGVITEIARRARDKEMQ